MPCDQDGEHVTSISELVEVSSAAELWEIVGVPTQRTLANERRYLDDEDKKWLAASRFCLVATAGADGTCDVSPRGGPSAQAYVVDDTTVAIPDYPGNARVDNFHNILDNPHIGLLFIIPGRTDALRVNGRARLLRDAPFFDRMTVGRYRPKMAILVEVEQVYLHCPKAFRRSQIWQPETWRTDVVASTDAVFGDEPDEISAETADAGRGAGQRGDGGRWWRFGRGSVRS